MESLEDQFGRIANGCIQRAEAVNCTIGEFAEGMTQILHAIAERRNAAVEEAEDVEVEDEDGE